MEEHCWITSSVFFDIVNEWKVLKYKRMYKIIEYEESKEIIMKKLQYVITDTSGIHARPAGLLVKEASKFQSEIKIAKGEKNADCKSIFGIMGLAVKQNETITILVDGPDEEEAALSIEKFLQEI